ncbi:heterokaryon incompatibility protein-domain-containing protein [Hypoxylon rubiginosum]|uniref:Heterokaryon incompatibility protein-domain-containing protein n=1 Tax=Hypoxylon rubiginosum TaxID=110542 RepID=A0ACB9Z3S5_9PEZI|nr:heterokaryon incompatibility protein-domain-containing protein [Hypoxylon rubiginosum]
MAERISTRYKYTPLDVTKEDIRLVKLLPGDFDRDIHVQIIHQPFKETESPVDDFSKRLSIGELQETLPYDWTVKETIEGRYLFISKTTNATSWDHPLASVPGSAFATHPDNTRQTLPKYDALSYTWGRGPRVERIYVVSEDQESAEQSQAPMLTLDIHCNLANAMRYIRHADQARNLWIDAICINQADLAERDLQIKRMGRIFGRSAAVIIWLGPSSSSSSLALAKLHHLGQQVEHTVGRWYPSPGVAEPALGDPRVPLPFDEEAWDAIRDLLSRAWFERVWVQQEARYARSGTVQCGSDAMPWNFFRRAVLTLREKASLPKRLVGPVEDARGVCNSRYRNDFFWLMVMSRKQKCAELRDKVYGVLALCPPKLTRAIKPRYDKPLIEVYMEAFLASSAIARRLDLLSHINHGTSSWGEPSWVPDWSRGVDNFLQMAFFSTAAGMSEASYEFVAPKTLRVKGLSVGEVRRAERAVQGDGDRVFEIWRHADTLGVEGWSGDRSGELLEAFLDPVLTGKTRERYPTNLSYPSWVDFKNKLVNDESGDGASLGMLLPQIRTSRLRNLSFIVTSQGLLGLAPTHTAPGEFSLRSSTSRNDNTANHHHHHHRPRRPSLHLSRLPHAHDSPTRRTRRPQL